MAQVPANRSGQGGPLATRRGQHPMDLFRNQFENLFERMWNEWLSPFDPEFGRMANWGLDVTENDNEIVVRADAPGFDENELDVRLEDNVLTIRAEKELKGDGRQEHRSLYRTVTLPSGIDPDKVQASYRNGVLELHIPRPEGTRRKRIPIQGQLGGGTRSAAGTSQQAAGQQAAGQQAAGTAQANQAGSEAAGGTAQQTTSRKGK